MKRLLLILLLLCAVGCLTACNLSEMTPKEMHGFLDNAAAKLGRSQLTEDDGLIGTREAGEDAFTGAYHAALADATGRDVVFGGASILNRVLKLEGRIAAESGTAAVRIRMNDEVVELMPDADGWFMTEIHMGSGGNYIMIDYTDFIGKAEMHCAYSDRADGENGET